MIQTLKLEQIRRNGGTQPREEIDWPLVDQFRAYDKRRQVSTNRGLL
jgi:hypothetical protein